MFKPNLSVKETLDHLATRLNPYIASKLASVLAGQPWTKVLEILDKKKDFSGSYLYRTNDLQAQLRMITERLGDLGHPFDNRDRLVNTLGSELRIVRKQSAHNHEFTILEAFRASDFAVRLLRYMEDKKGLEEALRIRHQALRALAEEQGVTEDSVEERATPTLDAVPDEEPADVDEVEEDSVHPDPEVLKQEPKTSGDQILGSDRLEFEPWEVVPVGDVEVLNNLRKNAAKSDVRTVAIEIATFEGPIHIDRLTRMVGRSFGLSRVRKNRSKRISYQIEQAGLFVDEDQFVWPREIDPSSWTEFRPNDNSVRRSFTHISPVEISNAARFIKAKHSEIDPKELEAAVLRTFGRKQRTGAVKDHLSKARKLL